MDMMISIWWVLFAFMVGILCGLSSPTCVPPPKLVNKEGKIMDDARHVSISIETSVHQEIAETLQRIHDDYGVTVRDITPDWYDVSTTESQDNKLMGLNIVTTTGTAD